MKIEEIFFSEQRLSRVSIAQKIRASSIFITCFFFRKIINSDYAPEILFSEEYYPQIVQFLSDEHARVSHLKFNFVLTVIYESPISEKDEGVEKPSHESFRKGRYILFF